MKASSDPFDLLILLIITNFTEDELQNIEMAEDERTKKSNELKIKRRDYTGYDDDEFVDGKQGMKRAVLAKYDEDINGVQETVSVSRNFPCHLYPVILSVGFQTR